MISPFGHFMYFTAGAGIILALLAIFCAVAGGLCWYLHMVYSQYDSQKKRSSEETRRRTYAKTGRYK